MIRNEKDNADGNIKPKKTLPEKCVKSEDLLNFFKKRRRSKRSESLNILSIFEFAKNQPGFAGLAKLCEDKNYVERLKDVIKFTILNWEAFIKMLKEICNSSEIKMALKEFLDIDSIETRRFKILELFENFEIIIGKCLKSESTQLVAAYKDIMFEMIFAFFNGFVQENEISDTYVFDNKKFKYLLGQFLIELEENGFNVVSIVFPAINSVCFEPEQSEIRKKIISMFIKRGLKKDMPVACICAKRIKEAFIGIIRTTKRMVAAIKSENEEMFEKNFENYVNFIKQLHLLSVITIQEDLEFATNSEE